MKIYLAGPLFTAAERWFNSALRDAIVQLGHEVFLPQEHVPNPQEHGTAATFQGCIAGIQQADAMIAIVDGSDADSGTCLEMGFALADFMPIIGIRTDLRGGHEDRGLNLMISHACNVLLWAPGLDASGYALEAMAELERIAAETPRQPEPMPAEGEAS